MTTEAERTEDPSVQNLLSKNKEMDAAALEDLFLLGYTRSPVYTIYKDEDGHEITVQFRTLMPHEIRTIAELVHRFSSPIAQLLTEQMEVLSRAILYVNGMPLILPNHERDEFALKNDSRQPSSLDMARIILVDKVKSEHILDAMYDSYQEFVQGIEQNFEAIKKKLKNPSSSESTS